MPFQNGQAARPAHPVIMIATMMDCKVLIKIDWFNNNTNGNLIGNLHEQGTYANPNAQ